jgi:hypothetical protein
VCETAAATASINFHKLSDDGHSVGNPRSPSPPSRPNSPSHGETPDDCSVLHGSRPHTRRSSSASGSHLATTPPVNGSPNQSASSIPIQADSHNGESPWNPYPGSSPHYTTATYPQQYLCGVQGVPIVGSTYGLNLGLFYQNVGFYQIQPYIQVQQYPVVLVPSITIQQPAQRSSRQGASRVAVPPRRNNAQNFRS